jgi:hypothetical protein
MMSEISVILLSWKRVANLAPIIDSLRRSPLVGEIIVWNNNPEVQLELPGALVFSAPQNYFGLARYCVAPLARHDTIWFQDDDMLLEPEQLLRVHSVYAQDPARIYGCRGRNVIDGRYRFEDVFGECDIILGQSMLFHRRLLANFFRYAAAIPPITIGDDIVFSLSCGRRHFAVDVEPVRQLGWDDEVALWRRPDHFDRRQNMVDLMLSLRGKIPAWSESDAPA